MGTKTSGARVNKENIMLEINKEVKNMDYRKALPHVGHNIVISNYSNENIAVECEDCHEVIVDADISKGKVYE